jgi:hypothetical protein
MGHLSAGLYVRIQLVELADIFNRYRRQVCDENLASIIFPDW